LTAFVEVFVNVTGAPVHVFDVEEVKLKAAGRDE
jgi:hypothetical protein